MPRRGSWSAQIVTVVTALFTHPSFVEHEMPFDHPESPRRLAAINDALVEHGLMPYLERYEAPAATDEQLLRVHTAAHLAALEAKSPASGYATIDPDTFMNPHTLDAARHAAGAVVGAVDEVMAGTVDNAFCAVRPPGHHATRSAAMGFCFFNNVAVGAAHALAGHGLDRVAIIDFDVHQGNGTVDAFGDDDRVLFCSTFQHPFYPHSAPSPGEWMIDAPLPAGSGSAEFRTAVEAAWLPRIEAFAPQLVLMSAGFDGHRRDHLAHFDLTEDDYRWVTAEIAAAAAGHCGGRIVSTLEGGYDLVALGASVVAHIEVLLGI